MSNVGVMPAEVVETNYQVRVLRTELMPGSQGAGTFNGGLGLRREYEIIDHAQRATFYAEQTHGEFAPEGAAGGRPGGDDGDRARPGRIGARPAVQGLGLTLAAGSVIRVETAGGGGYGDPAARSPERVAADRAAGTSLHFLTPRSELQVLTASVKILQFS